MTGRAATRLNPDNPWPGARAYREEDAPYFRGRDREVDDLWRRVRHRRLVVLFGSAGVGKSSLLQAGLVPRLRATGALPVTVHLSLAPRTPKLREQIAVALGGACASAGIEAPSLDAPTLWELFQRKDADFWDQHQRLVEPVLLLDQFESLVREARSCRGAPQELEELWDLIDGRPPVALRRRIETTGAAQVKHYDFCASRYRVVIALSSDALAEWEMLHDRRRGSSPCLMGLGPLDGSTALGVLEESHLFASAAIEQAVRLAAGETSPQRGIPLPELEVDPLALSVLVTELNRTRLNQGRITTRMVEAKRAGVLEEFYDRVLGSASHQARELVEERLVNDEGVALAHSYEQAREHASEEELTTLLDAGLLEISEQAGFRRVELAHGRLGPIARRSREQRLRDRERREREQTLLNLSDEELERFLGAEDRALAKTKRRLLTFAYGSLTGLAIAALIALVAFLNASRAQRTAREKQLRAAHAAAEAAAARRAEQTALAEKRTAHDQQTAAERHLSHIQKVLAIRQAFIAPDREEIDRIARDSVLVPLRFKVGVRKLPARGPQDQFMHQYLIMPEADSIPGGLESVATLLFRLDHRSFKNRVLTAPPRADRKRFLAAYEGWGCVRNTLVLIEYVDQEKLPGLATLDTCKELGW